MRLIWHIIKKDITRDRWALLLWALLFVAQTGLGFALLRPGFQKWGLEVAEMQGASVVLVALQMIMGYILVARLVQADALIGTDMFWLTRPLSQARLLVAKALGALLIFGLLPVLLLLPWWLYCHFGVRDIAWAAVETLGWQLLMVAPAFLVASLTDDLGRVLLWTLLMVIGLLAWLILLQASYFMFAAFGPQSGGLGVLYTRLWLCGMLIMTGAAAIAAHQFLTRRLVRSVGLTVALLGVIALTGQLWPWDWSRSFINASRTWAAAAPAEVVAGIAVDLSSARVRFPASRGHEADINVRFLAHGVPGDLDLLGEFTGRQNWSWNQGLSISRLAQYGFGRLQAAALRKSYALPTPMETSDDPETSRWWQARREDMNARFVARGHAPPFPAVYVRPVPLPRGVAPIDAYTALPGSIVAKIRQEAPRYEADLACILARSEIVVELPLKAGAQSSAQSQTFELLSLVDGHQSAGRSKATMTQITGPQGAVRITAPAVRENGLWLAEAMGNGRSPLRKRLMTVNHATGDIQGTENELRNSPGFPVAGVVIRWESVGVFPSNVIRNGQWVAADPQWLEHTTLDFVTEKIAAQFTRQVRMEKFVLERSVLEKIDGVAEPAAKP